MRKRKLIHQHICPFFGQLRVCQGICLSKREHDAYMQVLCRLKNTAVATHSCHVPNNCSHNVLVWDLFFFSSSSFVFWFLSSSCSFFSLLLLLFLALERRHTRASYLIKRTIHNHRLLCERQHTTCALLSACGIKTSRSTCETSSLVRLQSHRQTPTRVYYFTIYGIYESTLGHSLHAQRTQHTRFAFLRAIAV